MRCRRHADPLLTKQQYYDMRNGNGRAGFGGFCSGVSCSLMPFAVVASDNSEQQPDASDRKRGLPRRRDEVMADNTPQEQRKQRRGGPGRPFVKGRSGNPAGRPPGSRNRATRSADALLAGGAEALTRKAIALALDGDAAALRLCLERLVPPRRGRTVRLPLPRIRKAADIEGTMAAITAAVARGVLTPGEAAELGRRRCSSIFSR
jgi:hypothetical protein